MKVLYTSTVSATQGREGKIHAQDGTLDMPLAMPKALGGAGGAGTNPEQLFAAGYAACFGSALKLCAAQKSIKAGAIEVTAHVSIGKTDTGLGLAVELVAKVADISAQEVKQLLEAAHKVCPYSLATKGNIEVKLSAA